MPDDAPDVLRDRPPSDPGGPTRRLASWLARTDLDSVPAEVRDRAAHLLLDGLGCALVGAQLPWSRRGVEAITELETGTTPLIGWGGRTTSAAAAAMLNSSFIQGFELDDFHPLAPLHSTSLVLPAMLAATSGVPGASSGASVLRGAILGFETGTRVGLALRGGEMLTRGWHSGPVFGAPAAAVAAGSLYGLDAAGFEDALGIAATQAGGLMSAQFESEVKRMQHGFAARNGLYAAALAARGYIGIKQVFERGYGGYLGVFGEGHDPDPSQLTAQLGERWETSRIAVKPYAAMGGLLAAVDAAIELRQGQDITADEVAHIDIWVSEPVFHHGGWPAVRPLQPIGAQMSLAYSVAVALLDGDALLQQYTAARIDADDVWELMLRTETHHDPAFDDLPPRERLTTRVEVQRTDGSWSDTTVTFPRGIGDRELTNAEVVDKYRSLTADVISPARRAAIERAVVAIDRLDDVADLLDLLTPSVEAAL